MEDDQPLRVFARSSAAPPLSLLFDALALAGHPVQIGVTIAGEASAEELAAEDWDAAFLRWTRPAIHEICLLERNSVAEDDVAMAMIAAALRDVADSRDSAGELIVAEHLHRTRVVYDISILPALLAEDDHPAWAALDLLLLTLADAVDGMIYVQAEGYCDATGELILSEEDMRNPQTESNDA